MDRDLVKTLCREWLNISTQWGYRKSEFLKSSPNIKFLEFIESGGRPLHYALQNDIVWIFHNLVSRTAGGVNRSYEVFKLVMLVHVANVVYWNRFIAPTPHILKYLRTTYKIATFYLEIVDNLLEREGFNNLENVSLDRLKEPFKTLFKESSREFLWYQNDAIDMDEQHAKMVLKIWHRKNKGAEHLVDEELDVPKMTILAIASGSTIMTRHLARFDDYSLKSMMVMEIYFPYSREFEMFLKYNPEKGASNCLPLNKFWNIILNSNWNIEVAKGIHINRRTDRNLEQDILVLSNTSRDNVELYLKLTRVNIAQINIGLIERSTIRNMIAEIIKSQTKNVEQNSLPLKNKLWASNLLHGFLAFMEGDYERNKGLGEHLDHIDMALIKGPLKTRWLFYIFNPRIISIDAFYPYIRFIKWVAIIEAFEKRIMFQIPKKNKLLAMFGAIFMFGFYYSLP